MELTINIEDYIKPDEIKAIAMDELRCIIHNQYARNNSEVDRLISNLSYDFIFKAVSEAIGDDAKKLVADNVKELLNDKSNIRYEMWRRKDGWQKTESPAIQILADAIEANKGLINDRVVEVISEFDFGDVRTAIYESLDSILYERLFGENQ